MVEEKEVLTAEELAEYLGFNKNWVYRKAEAGELPGTKLGKSWRFKRSVIDRWLEERIESAYGTKAVVRVARQAGVSEEAKARVGVKAGARTEEELPPEAIALLEQVFEVIKAHPEGVTLPKVGKSLKMDWRGLTSFVNRLVVEGRARKEGKEYFPIE